MSLWCHSIPDAHDNKNDPKTVWDVSSIFFCHLFWPLHFPHWEFSLLIKFFSHCRGIYIHISKYKNEMCNYFTGFTGTEQSRSLPRESTFSPSSCRTVQNMVWFDWIGVSSTRWTGAPIFLRFITWSEQECISAPMLNCVAQGMGLSRKYEIMPFQLHNTEDRLCFH